MLTVKHIESKNGVDIYESVVLAQSVSFFPEGEDVGQPDRTPPFVRAFGVADGGSNGEGIANYTSGRIYVMNDSGATVSTYYLDIPRRSRLAA
jgi:hypothetical protein